MDQVQAPTTLPASSGDTDFQGTKVRNGLLFLIMSLNNFANKQMDEGSAESETIQLLTNVEMNLSKAMMASLEAIQEQMNTIIESNGYCYKTDDPNGDPVLVPSSGVTPGKGGYSPLYTMSSEQTQYKMQSLNARYSTAQQNGTINTDTIQGFVQAFQTSLQMLMSAMQSMTSMYDSVASKEAYDASLVAG